MMDLVLVVLFAVLLVLWVALLVASFWWLWTRSTFGTAVRVVATVLAVVWQPVVVVFVVADLVLRRRAPSQPVAA